MKQFAIVILLLALFLSLPVQAKLPPEKETIEQLAKRVSDAYQAKALGKLDNAHLFEGKVRIVIEHSLIEDRREVKVVKTLRQCEHWLRHREQEDGTPFRESRPLLQCKKGLCTFNLDDGIDHNHLYIKKISYGYRNRSVYIKTVVLLDGD